MYIIKQKRLFLLTIKAIFSILLLPTSRNVNASSQRISLHYLVALSTTNTRGDCIICTSRELPTTADRARTATLYHGSRPSPEHYVIMCEASATDVASLFRPHHFTPRSARPSEHDRKTCLQTRRTLYAALVGLRTFWLLFHSSFYTTM